MKRLNFIAIFLFGISSCTTLPTKEIKNNALTPTPFVLQTIQNTSTPLSTSTPTSTASIPQLTVEPNDLTLELIRKNNGCKLPCWWGIFPNKTHSQEILNFLRPFSIVTTRKSTEWTVHSVRSPIDKVYSDYGELRFIVAIQKDLVKEIEIEEFNEETYYINNFLQSIGKPESILVSSYSSDAGAGKDIVPLTISLYYPKLGVLALYGSWANTSGNTITACFETGPHLFLWSPDSSGKYSIEYFLSWDKEHIPYRSIEESANLTIETFYEKYSNTKGELCLQTPRNLWPSQ